MNESPRLERVSDEILQLLSTALLVEIHDPRIQQLQLTDVQVNHDLSHANVYWRPLNPQDDSERARRAAQRALDRAAGFLRKYLADRMKVRQVPELHFAYDEVPDRARRIEELLSGLDLPPAEDAADAADDEDLDEDA